MTALARIPVVLLLAAFTASCLLHADRAPLWCLLAAAAATLWRWLHLHGRLALPGQFLRIALTLLLLSAVLVSFRTWSGLAAGSALLITMGAAKLLETRDQRDAVVVATVALILVMAAGLERQGLARLPAYLATGWLALSSIAALGSHEASRSARRAFSRAGIALVLAIPLAAICFVLVPRLPGGLWSLPASEQSQTGLADEMSPGSISELAISDEIAFRARFVDAAPPSSELYWRGPVLHDFDGFTWRRVPGQMAVRQTAAAVSPPLRYQIMLEPHGRGDLYALDTVARIEGRRAFVTFDGQVLASRPVTAPITYDAVSHLQVRDEGKLSLTGRRLDTRLPVDRNPRSIALAREMRAVASSDDEYAARVLDYLRDGGFRYSLTPPLLGTDSVDDLLFGSRLGFCGHFASAYVTLMRAANVPARVVTGYLGGTLNPLGGHYTVRQSEAHAWAEVWLDGRGWVRIDPTAVVAPERLRRTLGELLPESQSGVDTLFGSARWLRNAWDAAGGWWQQQIVNFNSAAQANLLAKLGLDQLDYRGMALLLVAAAALWMGALLAWMARAPRRPKVDALARQWETFIALLATRGVMVKPHDGPDAIRQRAARMLPEAAAEIDLLASDYARLRFGRRSDSSSAEADLRLLRVRTARIARATAARRRRRTAAATPG